MHVEMDLSEQRYVKFGVKPKEMEDLLVKLCIEQMADAQLGTIRLKLLKLGAQIRLSVRRIVIAFSSSWPGPSLFHLAYQQLQQLPRPG